MLGLGSNIITNYGSSSAPIGFAALFDGTNDFASLAAHSSLIPTGAITVSGWINIDPEFSEIGWTHTPVAGGTNPHSTGAAGINMIGCVAGGGWGISLVRGGTNANPSTQLRGVIRVSDDGSGSANYKILLWGGRVASVTEGTTLHEIADFSGWVHIAMTFDGDEVLLYINGSSDLNTGALDTSDEQTQATGSGATILYGVATSLKIGADAAFNTSEDTFDANSLFEGAIDEVALWDVALSSANITAIYNGGNPGVNLADAASYDSDVTGDLQGYWKMNEGTGTSVADSSSNSNTLTLKNGTGFTPIF